MPHSKTWCIFTPHISVVTTESQNIRGRNAECFVDSDANKHIQVEGCGAPIYWTFRHTDTRFHKAMHRNWLCHTWNSNLKIKPQLSCWWRRDTWKITKEPACALSVFLPTPQKSDNQKLQTRLQSDDYLNRLLYKCHSLQTHRQHDCCFFQHCIRNRLNKWDV